MEGRNWGRRLCLNRTCDDVNVYVCVLIYLSPDPLSLASLFNDTTVAIATSSILCGTGGGGDWVACLGISTVCMSTITGRAPANVNNNQ